MSIGELLARGNIIKNATASFENTAVRIGSLFMDAIGFLNDAKVDKVAGKGLSTNDFTNDFKNNFASIANKVDKIPGKGLSTLDFTAQDKAIVNSAVTGEEFYRFISNSNYADQMVIERAAYDSQNAIKAEAVKTAQNTFIADDAILKLITEINARTFGLEIFMNQFLLTDEFEIILDDNENPIITNEFQSSYLYRYVMDEIGNFIFDEFNNLITY